MKRALIYIERLKQYNMKLIYREFTLIYYTCVLTQILLLFLIYGHIWKEKPLCTFFAHVWGDLGPTTNTDRRLCGQWKFDHLKF